jgi:hypothetical protein
MSIQMISAVWENSPHESGTLLVQLAMADYANHNGECWPAVATLARKARLSDRQVQRCIAELLETKQIEFIRKSTCKGETNRYRMLVPSSMSPQVSGDIPRLEGVTLASHKPSTEEPSLDIGASFTEQIYSTYPRKMTPKVAKKSILAAIRRSKMHPQQILDATKRFAEICKEENRDQAVIAYPATWFNQDRFEDDPATWRGLRSSSSRPAPKPAADYSNGGGFGETRQLGI